MFGLAAIQAAIREHGLDGWLMYDFRGINILAARIAGTVDAHRSRRWFYYIPANGDPKKLVHRIDPAVLFESTTVTYASGTIASASISTSMSGSMSLLTSRIAVAGRTVPKISPWALPTACQSAMFVR